MEMHHIDEHGRSFHRRPEFGFCWVEDSAYDKWRAEQDAAASERLRRRNESRRRRGVRVVSAKEAAKRAERYRDSMSLDMDFRDYIRGRMYDPVSRRLAFDYGD